MAVLETTFLSGITMGYEGNWQQRQCKKMFKIGISRSSKVPMTNQHVTVNRLIDEWLGLVLETT